MVILFLKGFLIGMAMAVPVGPIALLCIQRSLHEGFKIGLMSGFGAALADFAYGIVAAFGLTTVSALLMTQQFWIRLIGGLFLIYLGIKLFLTQPPTTCRIKPERSAFHAFSTTFLLTLTNPATILTFIAIFAALGVGTSTDALGSVVLVLGIFLGSACWWFILAAGVAFILHHRLTPAAMHMINKISGGVIFAFGILALILVLTRLA